VARAMAQGAPDGDAKNVALLEAADRGNEAEVAALLDNGAAVNAVGRRSMSALIAASAEGHTDVARLLLKRGAELEAKNQVWWREHAKHTRRRSPVGANQGRWHCEMRTSQHAPIALWPGVLQPARWRRTAAARRV